MSVITQIQLKEIRNGCEKEINPQTYDKMIINAALQAIEDSWENNKTTLASNIDAAITPYTFTTSQKKTLGKYWLKHKFNLGG